MKITCCREGCTAEFEDLSSYLGYVRLKARSLGWSSSYEKPASGPAEMPGDICPLHAPTRRI